MRSMRLKFPHEAHGSRAEGETLIGRTLEIYEEIGNDGERPDARPAGS
jgi:hypothetical protein